MTGSLILIVYLRFHSAVIPFVIAVRLIWMIPLLYMCSNHKRKEKGFDTQYMLPMPLSL